MPGTLFVVATPIGNLEDITMRALRVLREAALIAAEDTRRTRHLLDRYGITTATTSLHEHNETRKAPTLISRLQQGDDIALVSDAGTPLVSDPGQRLVRAAIEGGIRIVPIPGPSAVLAALVGAGTPAASFQFMGFPPTRSKDRSNWLLNLSRSQCPVVLYEAPHRLRRTLSDIRDKLGDCQIVAARELTKVHEEFVRGSVSELLQHFADPIGEFTLVVEGGHTTNTGTNETQGDLPAAEAQGIHSNEPPSGDQLATEFGVLTNNRSLSRREAIRILAARYQLPSRTIYRAIEDATKSVE